MLIIWSNVFHFMFILGRRKAKDETGQGNRQVLGDIGNLEVVRIAIAEGKHISRPITRFSNFLVIYQQLAFSVFGLALEKGKQELDKSKWDLGGRSTYLANFWLGTYHRDFGF